MDFSKKDIKEIKKVIKICQEFQIYNICELKIFVDSIEKLQFKKLLNKMKI